ncbi:MAG: metal ABC transporter permease [Candidatus Nitronauta litoralis]|uniref:Metal ABC transporter permease n=1 Tax=Candidatus Nitronauta litoralis TaxID=2705533 RepID=A0A7T0BT64_9BACT|nr:MAG: metal ABC transporter permease [Candidatus Nitronauta litoralis]
MEFFDALSEYAFMRYALIGGLLSSIACGIVGTFVVVKRISYLAGGIAHSIIGGVGFAYFLEFSPVIGALGAAVGFSLLLGIVSLRLKEYEDTVISALWSLGMAVGILFLSKTPGYNMDLMHFLFGSILVIGNSDLMLIMGLDLLVIVVVLMFYKQFVAVSFDEEFARLRGVNVERFYLLFLILVGLTVVLFIKIVGVILVIALLTLPAAISGHYVRSMNKMMVIAVICGMVFTSSGLYASYTYDLPTGSMIVVIAGITYFLSLAGCALMRRTPLR